MNKNCSHNIKSKVTEARFASAVLNYNEGKAEYINYLNSIPEMDSFKISDKTGAILIENAERAKEMSKKNRIKKKLANFNRISNQVQNSDIVSVPAYKEDSK